MEDKPSIFTSINQYLNMARLTEENRTFQARPVHSSGKQLYTHKDLSGIVNPIAILLRLFCIEYKITEQEFTETHYRYKKDIGKTTNQINQDLGNIRKNLKAKRLTIDRLEDIIHILGYDIVDLSITVHNKETGTFDTFHSSDINKIHIPSDYNEIIEDINIEDDSEE